MPAFSIPNRAVIPAFNAAVALQSWLRPGLLAYIVGSHVEALRPDAVRLFNERAAMLDGVLLKYPDVYPADAPAVLDGKAKAGDAHPQAGQAVVIPGPNGTELNPFRSPEAGAEFKEREEALMASTTSLVVDDRLTIAHIRQLDTERLPAPRTMNNAPPTEQAVDFAALMVLVERPQSQEFDANGVANAPNGNGVHREAQYLVGSRQGPGT